MTRIEFFFNVENKLQKLAELSEKAIAKNVKLMMLTQSSEAATQIQQYLWRLPQQFLPNYAPSDALAGQSPIVVDWQGAELLHDEVLINLQHPQPVFFSRFRRLIEIVGTDEAEKAQARIRYKFYRDRGYEIKSYDAAGKGI
ncbi:MAG: DNA polymerase III subunit chi [Candidatus Methylopumilus sp.]